MKRWSHVYEVAACGLLLSAMAGPAKAQSSPHEPGSGQVEALKREFFGAIKQGDAKKFLTYVPERGVNVGPQAEQVGRADVEEQLLHHRGLYCQLFDSSCINAPIKLDASARACSYRELLTKSEKMRLAATEAVRSGVRQAILVAEVKNDQCAGQRLIDFIFNLEPGGWKLFSVP
jgi:hypothetical protein